MAKPPTSAGVTRCTSVGSRNIWILRFLAGLSLSSLWTFLRNFNNHTMAKAQTLLLSHSFFFAAGFVLGKYVDYEELTTYREIHESSFSKWRRRLGGAALGAASVMTLFAVFRATSKLGQKE
mmetsp:Transcript_118692/g.332399  ORF Transcript_118692/g.332399 Transcript_118692/m.332399 type:complete len:122 (-) Transcript_118692:243-608(-)